VKRAGEVLLASLQLGLTSFGGPMAHLGYFERTYVQQRKWLTGEESRQPGRALSNSSRTSQQSGRVSWSACATLDGRGLWPRGLGSRCLGAAAVRLRGVGGARAKPDCAGSGARAELVAVAVVAQAVWNMARRLCPDRATTAIALAAAFDVAAGWQPIDATGRARDRSLGRRDFLPRQQAPSRAAFRYRSAAAAWSHLRCTAAADRTADPGGHVPHSLLALAALFYRAGALVFGGGHVVLPLLRDAMVRGRLDLGRQLPDRVRAGAGGAGPHCSHWPLIWGRPATSFARPRSAPLSR